MSEALATECAGCGYRGAAVCPETRLCPDCPEPGDGALIFAYSRADAIADGVLVDVSETAHAAGLEVPTALTSGAHEALGCERPAQLFRVLSSLVTAVVLARRGDRVDLALQGTAGWVSCWALCGPGDRGEPVVTVMLEGED